MAAGRWWRRKWGDWLGGDASPQDSTGLRAGGKRPEVAWVLLETEAALSLGPHQPAWGLAQRTLLLTQGSGAWALGPEWQRQGSGQALGRSSEGSRD